MYQLSPYGQTQAQPYNPYANAYQATAYPTSYQTQMPASYTTQPAANDAFYNAAAWRAAMPTPNLTFNYNMGAGGAASPYGQAQTQAYSPYTQATSPYAQYQQPQQYPGMQQYGQYPQANQFSPYAAQQQYSPYAQTAGAYPYGQAAGAYGQPGAYNPYATQPGMNPMGGADMFNPAGMPGMDSLSNPATTGVDNLMTPPPAAPVEKKSGGFLKWTGITAVVAGLYLLAAKFGQFWPFEKATPEVPKVDVKDVVSKTKKSFESLKTASDALAEGDTKTSVDAAITEHGKLTAKLGDKPDTEKLQNEDKSGPSAELSSTSDVVSKAGEQVDKHIGELETDSAKSETKDDKKKANQASIEKLNTVRSHLTEIEEHLANLTKVATGGAVDTAEPTPAES